MNRFPRITLDPAVMGGKPCIRGLRVTAGAIVGLLAAGHTEREILDTYPYLEAEGLREALRYAAWRLEESETSGRSVSILRPPAFARNIRERPRVSEFRGF